MGPFFFVRRLRPIAIPEIAALALLLLQDGTATAIRRLGRMYAGRGFKKGERPAYAAQLTTNDKAAGAPQRKRLYLVPLRLGENTSDGCPLIQPTFIFRSL